MSNFSRIVCLLLLQICLIVNSGAGFSQTDGDPGSQDLDVVQVDFFAPADGGEDVGYRKSTYEELGVWGDKQILDTPYSMFVISEKLIENTQARNPEQVFKMNPLTMSSVFDINMISNITTRGFGSSHMLINGIPSDSLALGVFLEDVSSVEIMSGLNGFLYGAGNVGGVLNYVLKRPTQETLRKISLGNYGGQQYYGHADFGGKIDKDGKFAYRFNVFKQGGETNIENQELDRFLISGALDIKPNDDLLIQLNGSYGQYHLNGRQTQFWTGDVGLPFIPEPMDGSKLWGPDDTFNDVDSLNLGVGIKYKINDMFKLRMAFNHRKDSRKMLYTTASSFVNNNTEYQFSIMAENAVRTSEGGYFYIDSEFPTGPVSHNVTLGFNGYKQTTKNSVFDTPTGRTNWPSTAAYQFSIHDYNASNLKAFNWYQYESGKKKSNVSSNLNFLLADTIKFNEQWTLMAGLNRTAIDAETYNAVSGDLTSSYKKSALTPTVSLIFKPIPNITAYVSYMEALEQGTIVGATYKNAGSILDPLKSEQYEAGIKAEFNNMLMTLAAFQIDKGLQYSDDNTPTGTFVQDGRQVHRGLEATLQGKLFDKLTLLGGFTLLDPKVKKTSNPLIKGKGPIFIPKVTASLYSEYDLGIIDGLTVTGGVYYVGKSPANVQNTLTMSSYTTLDAGLRYKADIFNTTATFLFNVTNITDKKYWTGQPLASPRAFAFSAQFEF